MERLSVVFYRFCERMNKAPMADGSSTSMPLPPSGSSVVGPGTAASTDGGAEGSLTQQLAAAPPAQAGRMNYVKLLKLFTNKHTCELYERQVASLRRMVRLARKSSTGGFAMASLPLVQRILSLTCDNVRLGRAEFVDPACSILETLGSPFERIRANEEFHSKDIICDTLVVMSGIVDSPQCGHRIVMSATNAVKAQLEMQSLDDAAGTSASVGLASAVNKDDLRPNMWQFKQEAVDRSGMIKIIMSAFRRCVADARVAVDQGYRPGSVASMSGGLSSRGKQQPATALLRYNADESSTTVPPSAGTGSPEAGSGNAFAQSFELLRAIIAVLRELAYTKRNAESLTREGAPLVLFRALELVSSDLSDETVELAVDVLWNLLEVSSDALRGSGTGVKGSGPGKVSARNQIQSRFQLLERHRSTNCLRMLGKARVVGTLRGLLERSIVEGFRARDKELRNNILVAASLLTRRAENQKHFVETGFLSLLLLYSCAQEVGLPTDADEHNFATQSEQDFELKRLMWQEIGDLCAGAAAAQKSSNAAPKHSPSSTLPKIMNHGNSLSGENETSLAVDTDALSRKRYAAAVFEAVSQAPIVDALLLYLDARGQAPDGLHWTKPQMHTLTIDACALLLETLVVPACVERFVESGGPCQVLGFIQELALVDQKRRLGGGSNDNDQSSVSLAASESMSEQNNEVRSERMINPVPRRGVDPAMTIAAMRLLERSCRIPGCAAMMGEMGAMKSLVALFSLSFGEQDDMTTEFRTICASIVADLCDPDAVTALNGSTQNANDRAGKEVEQGDEDDTLMRQLRAERRASVVNQKLFRRAGGVDMVRLALNVTSDELAIKGPRLCMSLVDLTWRAVVGNRRSEAIFIAEDGVDTLLNLIEQVPASMHRQVSSTRPSSVCEISSSICTHPVLLPSTSTQMYCVSRYLAALRT